MRIIVAIVFIIFFIPTIKAQITNIDADSISVYFNQVKNATREHVKLWDRDIYGPIILVDPDTRVIYTNVQDANNSLTQWDGFFIGNLPEEISISNTSINWNGKTWAMVVLPLPNNQYDRVDLIVHELFHSTHLFEEGDNRSANNYHLDEKDGRIYLRLELAALAEALKANRLSKSEEHLRNALIFRRYRYLLYSGAQTMENSLELLEGLATYTGQIMSDRDKWQWREYLLNRLKSFKETPTFVRSFAYETLPVYGFFLYQKNNDWNKDIDAQTDLTSYLSEAFGLEMRIVLSLYVKQVAEEYHLDEITQEEINRNQANAVALEEYREKFFDLPRLEIKLEKMDMSFNPKNLIPLDVDEGTIYPTLRINDNWGILNVTDGGALMTPGSQWIVLSAPVEINDNKITGDGWTLQLQGGYTIEKTRQGNYLLTKKNP